MTTKVRKSRLSRFLRPFALFALNLGIDPRALRRLRSLPRFAREYLAFRRSGGSVDSLHPVLGDYFAEAGSASGHYFHQDLLVARLIHEAKPRRHLDVGSRLDGFVAHVAAFREIEVMDIRPLTTTSHHRIKFIQGDLMRRDAGMNGTFDSVSSLHALEHFGLGRYGDTIDPEGHIAGFRNLSRMVAPGGSLYVSLPIGSETQVYFNAHRVFHPEDIFSWFESPEAFAFRRFDYVDDDGNLNLDAVPQSAIRSIHGCGIYTFTRVSGGVG